MRKSLLLLLISVISGFGFTQVTTNSPYSSYGLGEAGGMDHAVYLGMGNTTITSFDSTLINYYNPASYNTLAQGQPLFTTGISSRISTYTEGDLSHFNSTTGIQHFAFAFPVKKYFGFAFGLKPYARKGYSFSSGTTVGADSILYLYSGNGGINELFLGLSTDIINFGHTRLAVGTNLGYLFGESTNSRRSGIYESSGFIAGGVNNKIIDVSSFHFDIGTYLTHTFKGHSITLSAVIDPSQNLSGKFENGLYYTTNIESPKVFDTVSFETTRSDLTSAMTYSFGLNYKLLLESKEGSDRRLNSEFSFNGMYTATDWNTFSDPFDSDSITYTNTSKLSFGVQYSPETKIIEKSTLTKFHERMKYRAGFYSYTLPFEMGGDQVTDKGVTIGLGFPFIIQKSLSSINLGFSYGSRGVKDSNLLHENYYGINLGITIAPGISERWFRKPKLN